MESRTSVLVELPHMSNHDLYRVYTSEDESVIALEDSATGGEIFSQEFDGDDAWGDLIDFIRVKLLDPATALQDALDNLSMDEPIQEGAMTIMVGHSQTDSPYPFYSGILYPVWNPKPEYGDASDNPAGDIKDSGWEANTEKEACDNLDGALRDYVVELEAIIRVAREKGDN